MATQLRGKLDKVNLRLLGPIKQHINIAHDLENDGTCVREVALDKRTRAALIVISRPKQRRRGWFSFKLIIRQCILIIRIWWYSEMIFQSKESQHPKRSILPPSFSVPMLKMHNRQHVHFWENGNNRGAISAIFLLRVADLRLCRWGHTCFGTPMATLIFQKGRGGYHGKTEPGLGTDKHTRDKCLVVYTLRHQVVSQVL